MVISILNNKWIRRRTINGSFMLAQISIYLLASMCCTNNKPVHKKVNSYWAMTTSKRFCFDVFTNLVGTYKNRGEMLVFFIVRLFLMPLECKIRQFCHYFLWTRLLLHRSLFDIHLTYIRIIWTVSLSVSFVSLFGATDFFAFNVVSACVCLQSNFKLFLVLQCLFCSGSHIYATKKKKKQTTRNLVSFFFIEKWKSISYIALLLLLPAAIVALIILTLKIVN